MGPFLWRLAGGVCLERNFYGAHVLVVWSKISMKTFFVATFSMRQCFTGVVFFFEGHFLKDGYFYRERFQCGQIFLRVLPI